MVRFHIDELEVFFPYEFVYPEQYQYMRSLKHTLDAGGHAVLEMPTGTGKTVSLFSLITSYQHANPKTGKLIYCTRTVPEMEKALEELRIVIEYRVAQLAQDKQKEGKGPGLPNASAAIGGANGAPVLVSATGPASSSASTAAAAAAGSASPAPSGPLPVMGTSFPDGRILALGMSARRNMCIHPEVSQEPDRDSIDEKCRSLTAPWVRQPPAGLQPSTAVQAEEGQGAPRANGSVSSSSNANANANGGSANGPAAASSGSNSNASSSSSGGGGKKAELCEWYENFENLSISEMVEPDVYTIDKLKTRAAKAVKPFCPYFAARRLMQSASVVVLNYQYVLDPKVAQASLLGVGASRGPPAASGVQQGLGSLAASHLVSQVRQATKTKEPSIVVFDEAHNIDNVCIEALSVNLTKETLDRALGNVRKLDEEIKKVKEHDQQRLQNEYNNLLHGLQAAGHIDESTASQMQNPVLPDDIVREAVPGSIRRAEHFLLLLRRVIVYLKGYMRLFEVHSEGPLAFLRDLEEETQVDGKTLKFCYERLKSLLNTLRVTNLYEYHPLNVTTDFCTLVGTYWEGFIIIVDPYPEVTGKYDPLLQLSCLDSSLAMRPVIDRYQSVVLTSGTISPLDLYPRLLGFQPVTTESFAMSLDRNCIRPLVVTKGPDQVQLSSRYELRDDVAVVRNYGDLLVSLAKEIPDGMVCFFTSYSYMEKVVANWYETGIIAKLQQHKLLFLETKDIVATTLALNNFRKACDCGRGAIFLSIARGKVAEGIDFDRHYGRAVVLIGVPFQYTLSRILKARLDFMNEKFGIQESEFLSFDAMRQAAQCIGRVIRSKSDYGIMIFADSRYARADKREKLPPWVRKYLENSNLNLSTDLAVSTTRAFLKEMSQPYQIGKGTRLTADEIKDLEAKHKREKATQGFTAAPSSSSSSQQAVTDRGGAAGASVAGQHGPAAAAGGVTPTPTTDTGKFAPWKCELPFKDTHGGRVTIVKAFEDHCKVQPASVPSDIRAAAFRQGLQKYPELYDLVSDLSPPESDDVEHCKNVILQSSGETEHKRMFTNFRSLFTLSTSDSSNVEKYIETVKAACQEISRLSLQEEIVPVWSEVGDKTDLSTWRVEKKLVPLLDPLTRRQGQLASLVLIKGISDSTVRANVESSIAPHMPFDGDDGTVAKFRHFAQPSCFSRLSASLSIPAQTHGVQLTGRSSTGHPRPRASGPSHKRPHCEHKTHRPEECLKQHYCSDCDH
uniref:DNA 5'-3' helicase n=1 Tax=Chromera velia CCMP2878 TaxID=1169474 RepID=A0A0G4HEZ2_9ALVE|eukprot:Cvel_6598.t1-p1 / transcript=Cvel_6598.t1 / gene=Cvel_6598 / organism=Chromera_velia_CCMP2878 / gene_product=DNA repair helicase UVH6, putative / transcript_product=DNA repair helicase UVH6, putative / location=Cvel_scaffold326:47726-63892(+) / protein_length=1239 / sequence_SO=supercontig / SO=protein_coding / is_pseudo=false